MASTAASRCTPSPEEKLPFQNTHCTPNSPSCVSKSANMATCQSSRARFISMSTSNFRARESSICCTSFDLYSALLEFVSDYLMGVDKQEGKRSEKGMICRNCLTLQFTSFSVGSCRAEYKNPFPSRPGRQPDAPLHGSTRFPESAALLHSTIVRYILAIWSFNILVALESR